MSRIGKAVAPICPSGSSSIWSADIETGDLSQFSDSLNAEASTEQVHGGAYAAKGQAAVGNNWVFKEGLNTAHLYMKWWLYVQSLQSPLFVSYVLEVNDISWNWICSISFTNEVAGSGPAFIRLNYPVVQYSYGTIAVATGWRKLELDLEKDASNDIQIEVLLDGVSQMTVTASGPFDNVDKFEFWLENRAGQPAYFPYGDDWQACAY